LKYLVASKGMVGLPLVICKSQLTGSYC